MRESGERVGEGAGLLINMTVSEVEKHRTISCS